MVDQRRRLLIVEDENLMLGMLRTELELAGFDVETAESAVDAKAMVQRFDPDIALIDIELKGGLSGLHLGHFLANQHPEVAQVFLTKFEAIKDATRDGFDLPEGAGFISKHFIGSTHALVDEIESVIRGREASLKNKGPSDLGLMGLSAKSRATLELLAEGYSNQYIAQALGVSVKSVEYHIDVVYTALGIEKSAEKNPRVEAALRYQRLIFTTHTGEYSVEK